jgi:hypothetical protein
MQTKKFARKPFLVDAVRVTSENMEEVAKWCGGEVLTEKRGNRMVKFIQVHVSRALNERQKKAPVGDWVLYAGKSFKCYTSKAFDDCFEKPSQEESSYANHPELPFSGPIEDTEAGRNLRTRYAAGRV